MKKVLFAIAIAVSLTMASTVLAAPIAPPLGNSSIQETMRPKITPHNYYIDIDGNDVVMHFLTSYKTEGFAMIIDMESGIEQLYAEGEEHTFHSVKAELPVGNYQVFAVSKVPFYGTIMTGKVITFTVR